MSFTRHTKSARIRPKAEKYAAARDGTHHAAHLQYVRRRDGPPTLSFGSPDPSVLASPDPDPAHTSCSAVHSGTTTAHTPSLFFCTFMCLPFVCSPTMSPLTSHPLIRDTRAMVAPCPPAKVTAMVEDSAATSDLDGTPDVPTVTAEPACGTLWTSEMTTHPCTHRTLQAATSSLLS